MQKNFLNGGILWKLSVIIIFLSALYFRLYNYPYMISVVGDSGRDLQVARYAFDHKIIPQIGQFSSAGPFFYGPWWYWILAMISILPLGQLTHWYFSTFLSLLFILLIYFLGKKVGGKWLGVTAAFFSAVSPAQITNSWAVWNPSIIPFLSLLILIFLVNCFEKKSWYNFFLLGFTLGLALTIHFQSLLLLPVLAVGGLFAGKKWKNYLFLLLGLLIPFIPLIYFDLRFNWSNFRSIWHYLTVGQYNIWVPNRWLTYIGQYWLKSWGEIIGGSDLLGGVTIILLSLLSLIRLVKFGGFKKFYLLAVTFLLEIIIFRYYRGERFFYYGFFAHPYVILFTAWTINELFKLNKPIGLLIFSIITIFSLKKDIKFLVPPEINFVSISSVKKDIYNKYPDDQFAVYGCEFTEGNLVSYPLSYFMYLDGRNEPQGLKIGVCFTGGQPIGWKEITDRDVNSQKPTWFNRTTEQIFKETVEWWKENPPT